MLHDAATFPRVRAGVKKRRGSPVLTTCAAACAAVHVVRVPLLGQDSQLSTVAYTRATVRRVPLSSAYRPQVPDPDALHSIADVGLSRGQGVQHGSVSVLPAVAVCIRPRSLRTSLSISSVMVIVCIVCVVCYSVDGVCWCVVQVFPYTLTHRTHRTHYAITQTVC